MTQAKREQRPLRLVDDATNRSVLVPDAGPALQGFRGDIDYTCPSCRRVLAEDMIDRQVYDIVIQCPSCQVLSEFPRIQPGDALIMGARAETYLYVRPGWYRVSQAVEVADGGMVGHGNVTSGGIEFPE